MLELAEDLSTVGPDVPVMLSSSLLGGDWTDIPKGVRSRGRVVHLTALAGEPDPALTRFRAWARSQQIQIREERHQALAFCAFLTFGEVASEMSRVLSRDYMMDLLQHMSNIALYLPFYRRAGITPGQRVLSRGGYVIPLAGTSEPVWVVP